MATWFWILLVVLLLLLAALAGGPRINAMWAAWHERLRHHD